jgi:parallel beta-helix repeat protein
MADSVFENSKFPSNESTAEEAVYLCQLATDPSIPLSCFHNAHTDTAITGASFGTNDTAANEAVHLCSGVSAAAASAPQGCFDVATSDGNFSNLFSGLYSVPGIDVAAAESLCQGATSATTPVSCFNTVYAIPEIASAKDAFSALSLCSAGGWQDTIFLPFFTAPQTQQCSSGGSTAGSTTDVYECRTISSPGNYNIAANLSGSSTHQPCITIENTSNVTINCGGNMVTGGDAVDGVIGINNVQNISITNCNIQLNSGGGFVMNVANSSGITLTGNTLGGTAPVVSTFNFQKVSNTSISGNTFNAGLQMNYATGSTVSNNTFLNPDSVDLEAAMIIFQFGSNNQITGNHIDGKQAGWDKGVDDGIVLGDETGDTITNNTIINNWDTGVEFVGTVKNTLISGNTISNYITAAIGGWYYMSLTSTTISNNTFNSTGSGGQIAFNFYRSYGLRPAGSDPLGTLPADTGMYFQNNSFVGNTSNNATNPGQGGESVMEVFSYFEYSVNQPQGGGSPIPNSSFYISNNTLKNNNFGAGVVEPYFGIPGDETIVSGAIIDGGGNICMANGDNVIACGQ